MPCAAHVRATDRMGHARWVLNQSSESPRLTARVTNFDPFMNAKPSGRTKWLSGAGQPSCLCSPDLAEEFINLLL